MPQMSPLDWLMLMIYFLSLFFFLMMMIYFLNLMSFDKELNKKLINLNNNFKMFW